MLDYEYLQGRQGHRNHAPLNTLKTAAWQRDGQRSANITGDQLETPDQKTCTKIFQHVPKPTLLMAEVLHIPQE